MSPAGFLDALHFLRPQWLWALALLPMLAWAWRRRSAARDPWRGVVDPHLLPHLLDAAPRERWRHRWGWLPACIAAAMAVLALAGPSWQRSPQPLWQPRAPLVVALDLSGSIAASDLPPSRLAQARARLAELFERRAGGDVGMLVYAEEPFVVAPLTSDARNVALFLDALSPDIMPGDVDAPARADRAIAMAADLLRQAGFASGDILLLTGAAGGDARDAARDAAASGYRVSVLGLGSAAGAAWRDSSGGIRHAALDEASLRALATAGDGAYAALASADPLATLRLLDPRDGSGGESAGGTASAWQDQGYWLLLPLLLLVAFGFRRGGALALLAACLLLPWQPASARPADLWQRSDQQAHARLERGAQAYRSGDYAAALEAWQDLPGADAAYNRGNALAQQGRYDEALEAYDRALQLQPGMADAIANREAVRKRMQAQPQPQPDGDGQQQPRSKPDQDGKQKQAPGERGAQAGQAPPPDADAQSEADAAQRERMREAMQPGEEGQEDRQGRPQPGERSESDAEREQRLANEAWLRRVPDDPGGLLRARFRLEYQRRKGLRP